MMFEYLISKRYIRSKHSVNFITIISLLSAIGITIGVAALIIVISVFNGFGSIVTSILINFDPHVSITANSSENLNVRNISEFLEKENDIQTFYPIVEDKAFLINGRNYQILNLKGITEHKGNDEWGIQSTMVKGYLNLNEDESVTPIAMGQRMALRLSCNVGDTIFVSSVKNLERQAINIATIPQTRKLVVTGLFKTDNKDYDIQYAFTPILGAQKIFRMKDNISGFEIRMKDISDSNELKENILAEFGDKNLTVKTWYDLHKDLYSVMLIERWAAFIILCLIISVATFNILSSLNMSVIEKRKDIGIMRSMGATKKSILKIFMFEGILVGAIGTLIGLLIGLVVCYLQIEYKLYPLDPGKYIIDAMPVQIRISDIIAICATSLTLSFLASFYPARKAAKLNVIDSIKYE